MINKVLVANRGEIARRVFATCRRLGIETVAVHSDADAELPFVREADTAVRLPGNTPTETYLRADLVLEAARRTGADAIHPGYGFLSENAEFARAVTDAGLTWIGPAPGSIEQMGSKIDSKKLMEAAGVPVLPTWTGTDIEVGGRVASASERIEAPLLVKASAGGGGRGMRIVRELSALSDEVATAASEAESAFGDGTVFVEPYVQRGRHVEVQVVGDGTDAVVFGTRDCSLQRRHQKVVEEAPAPNIPEGTREDIHEAARAAATSVGYVGAGTVEFLYDADTEKFYFLEMNTRLQVEHPVTEAIFGVDLVALQIAVAEDRRLPDLPDIAGHAIEVRLYAEDPGADYAPQTGTLLDFDIEHDTQFTQGSYGVRLDSGFEAGNEVGTFYDAMLAKVVAWAPTRERAARLLARRLETAGLHGLVTNRDQLVASLRHPEFLAGEMTTSFYDDHPEVNQRLAPDEFAPFVAAVALAEHRRLTARVQSRIPAGFRNVTSMPQVTRFQMVSSGSTNEADVEARWYGGRDGYRPADVDEERPVRVVSTGSTTEKDSTTEKGSTNETRVVLDVAGIERRYDVQVVSRLVAGAPRTSTTGADAVLVDGPDGGVTLTVPPRFLDPADKVAEGSLLAPMPGSVIDVRAAVGDEVSEGQPIVVMEAMKMQHTVTAPYDGVVDDLPVQAGDQVEAGAVLAVVSTDDEHDEDDEGASA